MRDKSDQRAIRRNAARKNQIGALKQRVADGVFQALSGAGAANDGQLRAIRRPFRAGHLAQYFARRATRQRETQQSASVVARRFQNCHFAAAGYGRDFAASGDGDLACSAGVIQHVGVFLSVRWPKCVERQFPIEVRFADIALRGDHGRVRRLAHYRAAGLDPHHDQGSDQEHQNSRGQPTA